jgi:hypothetical protein
MPPVRCIERGKPSMETDKRSRPTISYARLTTGAVVVYLMRPEQQPVHPKREWRGKVIQVGVGVMVESLEEGYEGQTELIHVEQIIRIENEDGKE